VALVSIILVICDPTSARIAMARLVNPFGDVPWPQVHHLAVRHPVERIARGQTFEVEVVEADGGELPGDVRIQYRFENPDGSATEESEAMRFAAGAMVARRENVLRSFSFRAEGGDDRSMPWQRVEVVDPPAIETLRARLIPPAYTGWPPEDVEGNFRASVGTQVALSARATKPLASAVLVLDGGREFPAELSEDGLAVSVPLKAGFVVEKSGFYTFRLADREGMTGGDTARWEVRAVEDSPPAVNLEQPRSNLFVTPQAVVPIRIAVVEDRAIWRIDLEYESPNPPADEGWRKADDAKPDAKAPPPTTKAEKPATEAAWQRIECYVGPERPAPPSGGGPAAFAPPETRTVEHGWELESLGLRPGMRVSFRATATDYRPQTGKSEPRQLSIITPEELAERIAARQAAILAELMRILEMQRQTRGQVGQVESRATTVALAQQDLDFLRGAELNQRRVTQTLTAPGDGIPAHLNGLLAELANNRIDSPEIVRRMEKLLAEIDRLRREELAAIGQELTGTIKGIEIRLDAEAKGAKPSPSPDAAAGKSLAAVRGHQDRVIESLEQMLDELGRWNSFRQFHRDVNQLLREQEELSRQTADLGRRTLTKELKDLATQDQADLALRSRDQADFARRLERIQQGMEQAVAKIRESDPVAAQTVADALARSKELDVAGTMRTAAGQVERNQMGQAVAGQRQVERGLREILDLLSGRKEQELTGLIKKLKQAETDLADLARREVELKKQFEQGANPAELRRAADEQQKLQQETERKARELQQLNAQQAAQAAGQASQKMGEAGKSGQQGEGKKAGQQAEEARKNLEQARRDVAQQRQEEEARLATEKLARIQEAIQSLHARQQKALEETRRLADLQRSGPLTPGQEASLGQLAREERMLETETTNQGERLGEADVFKLALSAAAQEMGRSASLLDRGQTGEPTQRAEEAALARLALLLEALKPEPPEEKPEEKKPAGGPQGKKGSKPPGNPGGIPSLAQVKLLKLMQVDVNRRTAALEASLSGGKITAADARREGQELSAEQTRLAQLLMSLIPPADDPQEPDGMPQEELEGKPGEGEKPSNEEPKA
jgi:hypothetical protein